MLPHIEIAAEKVFELGNMPIPNTLLSSVTAAGLLMGAGFLLFQSRMIPSAFQSLFEVIVEKFLRIMEPMFGSRARAERYIPIILTIFFFVLTSNWLGIVPGVGSVGLFKKTDAGETLVPLFRSAASDPNTTLALGIVAIVWVHILGVAAIGFRKHAGKFFSLKGPIDFFTGVLEFISEIAKILSFSFRLFGNIFAGEVLLIIIAFLAPYIIPVPFLALELFVGFIQALVFAMLTMVFIRIATAHH